MIKSHSTWRMAFLYMRKEGVFLMEFVYYYMVAINIIGFAIMGRDKHLARKKQWRISESSLWFIAIIGGAIGSAIGMYYFRHKTKHVVFKVGFPLLAVLQIAALSVFR